MSLDINALFHVGNPRTAAHVSREGGGEDTTGQVADVLREISNRVLYRRHGFLDRWRQGEAKAGFLCWHVRSPPPAS